MDELLDKADTLKVWDGGEGPENSPTGKPKKPGNFESLDEVKLWLTNVKNIDYDLKGITDIDQANRLSLIMEQMSIKYPSIHFDLAGVHGDLIEGVLDQFDILAKDWPDAANKVKYIGTYRSATKPPTFEWGFPGQKKMPVGFEDEYAHAVHGHQIGLNPRLWGDAEKLRQMLLDDKKAGWTIGGSPRSVITHEFGHIFNSWLADQVKDRSLGRVVPFSGDGLLSELWGIWKDQVKARKSLSRYATTKIGEAWAEGFSAMYHTPKSKWPVYVKKQKKIIDVLLTVESFEKDEWMWMDDFREKVRQEVEDPTGPEVSERIGEEITKTKQAFLDVLKRAGLKLPKGF